jgi:hypothetical protein
MLIDAAQVPRLLYVADVPVEATVAGSTQLYRLLIEYPSDRLRVWTSNLLTQNPASRLSGVQYETFFVGIPRLQRTRLEPLFRTRLLRRAPTVGRRLARRVARDRSWQPQAVLTVAHGSSWLAAATVASQLKIPLHLIAHDDVRAASRVPSEVFGELDQCFGDVWRGAASRMCASQFMVEKYSQHFGAPGVLLSHGRAPGMLEFGEPPARIRSGTQSLTVAYGGLISSNGYGSLVAQLAKVLEARGHQLVVFTEILPESVRRYGLDRANVTLRPFVPVNDLIRFVHENADALYVPMSFAAEDRANMEIGFPTKLADYSAAALPILVHGPEYCSAVRWARQNPTAAAVVDQEGENDLIRQIEYLEKPDNRHRLAEGAVAASKTHFSRARSAATFYGHLMAGRGND